MPRLMTWTALAFTVFLLGTTMPTPLPEAARDAIALGTVADDAVTVAERPRAKVDVRPVATTGRIVKVPADGDLQKAIDEAKPGDRIELEPGATYEGPFSLKRKDGQGWIVITSASPKLPPAGRHVDPSQAPLMARLVASKASVIQAGPGVHHYRFVGLEIAPVDGVYLNTLVELGTDEKTVDDQPHHIIVERSYIHGDAKKGTRRGVAMNGRYMAVVDSYLSDLKDVGADAQAISGWTGAGPFRIANNYLEASGENVMFGGADPSVSGLVPSDIEVVHNHFSKPLRWRKEHPTFEGTEWAVKNLFELKNARRVVIDGNLFEYNWPHAQNGFSILFTVRNQDGQAPWSTIEDVIFSNNLVRHVAAGINILGHDDNQPSQQARRIEIRNNLFLDVGGIGGNGRLFQVLDGTSGVTIDHNTSFQRGSILFGGDHAPHTNFTFQNNVAPHNEGGISASGTAPGTSTLTRFFPDAIVRRNVFIGANAGAYPADNFFPASIEAAGLSMPPGGRLRVALAPAFAKKGTDGRNPGVDLAVLTKALSGVATIGLDDRPTSTADFSGIVQVVGRWRGSAVVFWTSLVLLAYIYFGYPLIAALRAFVHPKPRLRAAIEPHVTIVVVAHNETAQIGARIENLLALDYPRDRMDIVIGSDGSTDGTVERARAYESRGGGVPIEVRSFLDNRGKPAVINAIVPTVRGEIVLFADARQQFAPDTVRQLVANFADPSVGGASGELVLKTTSATGAATRGTAFYWRYEKFIRSTEGRADSTVGATGAIYAIRRDLFEPIPEDTLLDDVLIPLRIVRRGYRVVFEPAARAYDEASATAKQEFMRKARTNAGTFQLFSRELWLLNPFQNRLWFETVSHKALRLGLPVLHAALLVSNLGLTSGWVYQSMLAGQLAFYAAALVGYAQRQSRRRFILFSVPCAICLLSWAVVVGFFRFITDRQRITWERVSSTPTSASS